MRFPNYIEIERMRESITSLDVESCLIRPDPKRIRWGVLQNRESSRVWLPAKQGHLRCKTCHVVTNQSHNAASDGDVTA